jgi:predicted anti-sigma-YlaC factor YlaD
MMMNEINCTQVMEHICENLGEELNSPRCVDIKNHLSGCNNCKHYFKSVEDTINFYKKYKVELPEGAHQRLLEYLGLDE